MGIPGDSSSQPVYGKSIGLLQEPQHWWWALGRRHLPDPDPRLGVKRTASLFVGAGCCPLLGQLTFGQNPMFLSSTGEDAGGCQTAATPSIRDCSPETPGSLSSECSEPSRPRARPARPGLPYNDPWAGLLCKPNSGHSYEPSMGQETERPRSQVRIRHNSCSLDAALGAQPSDS